MGEPALTCISASILWKETAAMAPNVDSTILVLAGVHLEKAKLKTIQQAVRKVFIIIWLCSM